MTRLNKEPTQPPPHLTCLQIKWVSPGRLALTKHSDCILEAKFHLTSKCSECCDLSIVSVVLLWVVWCSNLWRLISLTENKQDDGKPFISICDLLQCRVT